MCTCKTVENVHPYGDTTATETMVELCDDCANFESFAKTYEIEMTEIPLWEGAF